MKMASATGTPEVHQEDTEPQNVGLGEDEPLLGRIGDASQREGKPLYHNLVLGTAIIAQVGLLLLIALVWASIFLHPLSIFSLHPILNSSAILLSTEAILILQPTHTPGQKRAGILTHFTLNFLAADALIAAFVVIEYNKFSHRAPHFTSAHGCLGLTTYCLLAIQALVGFTQYFVPRLYGGVDRARSVYKWHRGSGYVILVLMLATVAAATQTDTGKDFLQLKLWAVLVAGALVLVGVVPRIRKAKFGLGR